MHTLLFKSVGSVNLKNIYIQQEQNKLIKSDSKHFMLIQKIYF